LIKPRIYWRWNRDKYLFIRQNPGVYQNLHQTNTLGAEINSSLSSKLGTTGFGIEFRKEEIKGDWLRGGNESKSNLDGFGRETFGVFVDHRFAIGGRFDVTPGVYVNWYSDFKWNAFPGIDLGYNLSDRIRIFGNVGKSYRIPTFYDQYYSSPVEEGNPDLQPEQALTYELGIRFMKRGYSFEGNYFIRDANQLIDWIYDPLDSIWRSQNFQDITAQGVELAFNINFTEIFDPGFPISQLSVSYNYLDQNLKEVENPQSRYALEHVRNQLILGLEHRIAGKLKNSFNMRYIERVEQNPYVLIDDRLIYDHSEGFNIFVEATNLTDQQYTEVMTTMPGRWFRAGIKLNIAY
jgi:iron complex outermembrane receptor protein